jgi:predicted hotdog family 3-hydroxylacyl-ACP dehydratase
VNIAELIPHSGDMIWLDKIIACDDDSLTAELIVKASFLDSEVFVPAYIGIEYMSQAIAAYVGVLAKKAGEPVRIGFLLGTRRYNSNVGKIPVGFLLRIHITKILQDNNLGVFDCKINGDGIEISAQINVYRPSTDINFYEQ